MHKSSFNSGYMSNIDMSNDVHSFYATMRRKLEKNAHKDDVAPKDVPTLMKLLMTEIGEFMEQYMNDKRDENTITELADAANMLFLISRTVRKEIDAKSV